jgi:riboflavin biosynthesis pyrimidine reductase
MAFASVTTSSDAIARRFAALAAARRRALVPYVTAGHPDPGRSLELLGGLEAAGADVIVATGENEPARVRSALDQLGSQSVTSILLEGGPHLAGAFLDAGEIDEVRLFLAPLLLGGRAARDPLEGEGVEQISEALRALTLDCERVADDMLVCARLREW